MYSEVQLRERGGATAQSFRDIHDPDYVGAGLWISIHKATLFLTEDEFIRYVRQLQKNFPCAHCKEHFGRYLQDKPPEKYKTIKIEHKGKVMELGMFLWSWEFHNAVNKRLNKPIMSWDTACQLFIEADDCSKSCAVSK